MCQALKVCAVLEDIYEREASATKETDKQERSDKDEDEDDEEDNLDEDDDVVMVADFAEVKLLEAILHGNLESNDWASRFDRTLALFYKALGTLDASAFASATIPLTLRVLLNVDRAEPEQPRGADGADKLPLSALFNGWEAITQRTAVHQMGAAV
jgi:hypothetical protein